MAALEGPVLIGYDRTSLAGQKRPGWPWPISNGPQKAAVVKYFV
jgi:hypothetical protein